MTYHQLRTMTVAVLAVGAICGSAAACTSRAAQAPQRPAASPSTPSLPPFPTVSEQSLLAEASNRTGSAEFDTKSLASRAVTLQIGCVGSTNTAVSVQIYQSSTKAIYQVNGQPCDGTIQRIALTTNNLAPMKINASSTAGSHYSLLVTQK